MKENTTFLTETEGTPDWGGALSAFLEERAKRSGSTGTVDVYRRLLERFYGGLGKTPDKVTPDEIFSFAYGKGPSGKAPSAATVNLRIAALSSFNRFLARMGMISGNPCDRVQRTGQDTPPARGLDPAEIKRLLAAVPDTLAGKRDRAIITTLVMTGRRRAEVMSLKVGDLTRNGAVYYAYRSKGGRYHRRELPAPCYAAIVEALAARGVTLEGAAETEPIFNVSAHGFYLNLRRYLRTAGLPAAGVHVLRHSAAKLRRDAGETIEQVSSFLDHSSLAITTTYLRRLEGEQDNGWGKVAALLA